MRHESLNSHYDHENSLFYLQQYVLEQTLSLQVLVVIKIEYDVILLTFLLALFDNHAYCFLIVILNYHKLSALASHCQAS